MTSTPSTNPRPFIGTATCDGATLEIAMLVSEPAVVAAASAAPDAAQSVATMLHIGAMAQRMAASEVDLAAVQTAVAQGSERISAAADSAAQSVAAAFDAVAGAEDGALAKALDAFREDLSAELGGDDSAVRKAVEKAMEGFKTATTDMLALQQRVLRQQLSLDEPDSPLARLSRDQKEFADSTAASLTALAKELENLGRIRAVADRTTLHGLDFEEQVIRMLATMASDAGDGFEDVRTTQGSTRRKTGDAVTTIPAAGGRAAARVVFETKDTCQSSAEWDRELTGAIANRSALAALGIVRTKEQLPTPDRRISWIDDHRALLAFDPETDDRDLLRMAVQVVRLKALSLAPASTSAFDAARVSALIQQATSHLDRLDAIATKTTTIRNAVDSIDGEATKVKSGITACLKDISTELSA